MVCRLPSLWALAAVCGATFGCVAEDGSGGNAGGEVAAPKRDAEAAGGFLVTPPDAGPAAQGGASPPPGGAGGAGAGGGAGEGGQAAGGQGGQGGAAPPPDGGPAGDATGLAPDAASGETCGGHPIIDLNAALADGPFNGTTLGASEGLAASCGGAAGGEVVFSYRVDRPLDRLTVRTDFPETRAPTVVYIRSACEVAEDLACNRGTAQAPGTRAVLSAVAPGLYYIVVDTGSRDGGGAFRLSVETDGASSCRDTDDNDADGLVDLFDPGCETPDDDSEADPNPLPACADGRDNDGNGLIDYPADPQCEAAGDVREGPLCDLPLPAVDVGDDGGVFPVQFAPGQGAAVGSCGDGPTPEALFVLTLSRPSRVRAGLHLGPVFGDQAFGTTYIRTACADAATEVACAGENLRAGDVSLQRLDPGVYFIFAEYGFNWGVGDPNVQPSMHITVESLLRQCNDGEDNDADGRVDADDLGCAREADDNEGDDPAEPPACADGLDNDMDGLIDYPVDPNCSTAGGGFETGCDGNPLWQPVQCTITSWVWSADNQFQDLQSANANRMLRSGCNHDGQNPQGLCSLDGTGWVSVDSFPMVGCDAGWWHIGGEFTGQCGGHDGDTVRYLALGASDCWDYR